MRHNLLRPAHSLFPPPPHRLTLSGPSARLHAARPRWRPLVLLASALSGGLGLLGCSGDMAGTAPVLSPAQLYWALRLDQHAVNLALTASGGGRSPYDTLRLSATALNPNGALLTGAGPVTYSTTDSSVTVDSTGLVTAHFVTPQAQVIARLRFQNMTLADTALIQVTDTAPRAALATFSLQPTAGTSTTCNSQGNIFGCGPLSVRATDAVGDTLSGDTTHALLVAFTSSDSSVASVDQTGAITKNDTGHVTFYAATWAYGVAKRDSLRYVFGFPRGQNIEVDSHTPVASLIPVLVFNPPAVGIAVGGTVLWINDNVQPIDVVFDDSAAVQPACGFNDCQLVPATGAGNIPPFAFDSTQGFLSAIRVRSFPVAGTYHFHSRLYPTSTGVIYVKDIQ